MLRSTLSPKVIPNQQNNSRVNTDMCQAPFFCEDLIYKRAGTGMRYIHPGHRLGRVSKPSSSQRQSHAKIPWIAIEGQAETANQRRKKVLTQKVTKLYSHSGDVLDPRNDE